MAESQYGFPTEVLSLPSQGLLYPEDSPLRSGTIDVKYMTAKEEDILTSQNLIEQGVVITKLIESVVVTEGVNLDDMLVGDKNAIMVGTRILGYGSKYDITLMDPETNERVEHTIDLSKLDNKPIDEELLKNGNNFEYTLPNSKRVLTFKLLTQGDEKELDEIQKGYEKVEELTGVSQTLTNRLKYQIQSVDGNNDQKFIDNFVDNEFLALDTREFRKYMLDITPDIDMTFEYEAGSGKKYKMDIPIGLDFFWPAAE